MQFAHDMIQRPRCLKGHPAQTHSSKTLSASASTAWAFFFRLAITPLKKGPFLLQNAHKTVSIFLSLTLIWAISNSKSQALSGPRMVTLTLSSLRPVITFSKLAISSAILYFATFNFLNFRSRPCRRYSYDKGWKRWEKFVKLTIF